MAKIPKDAEVKVGRQPLPPGAKVATDSSERIDPLEGEAAPAADPLDVLKPTTSLGAAGRGLTQGVTLGFGDEGMAAADTASEATRRARVGLGLEKPPQATVDADPAMNPNSPAITRSFSPPQPAGSKPLVPEVIPEPKVPDSLADTYRKARDGYRADNRDAEAAHPTLFGAGEFAGGMAVPLPGGTAKTVLGKVGLGAARGLGYGVASGAGKSEAADAGDVALDSLRSGAFGTAGGAAGGAAEAGLGKLGQYFGAKSKQIETGLRADNVAEAQNSARGAYRQKIQDANRTLENVDRAANHPATPAAEKAAAQAFQQTQEYKDLVAMVARGAIEQAPEKVGEVAALRQALRDAPALADKATDEYLAKSTIARDVLPRVAHYGKPIAAAVAGGVLGGPLGVGAGALGAAAIGKPSRAIANLARNPRFQIHSLDALEGAANPLAELAGRAGPVLGADNGQSQPGALPIADADGKPLPDLVIPRHPRDGGAQGRPAVALPRRAAGHVDVHPLEPLGLTRVPEPSVDVQVLPPTQMTSSHLSTPEEIAADEEARKKERMMRLARYFGGRDDSLDDLQPQR